MTNWIEKYQTGKIIPSSREIPEITVYGKKNYLQELDKQQQKYLADMAKYKKDSAAYQSYQDSLNLYTDVLDMANSEQNTYWNTRKKEIIDNYKRTAKGETVEYWKKAKAESKDADKSWYDQMIKKSIDEQKYYSNPKNIDKAIQDETKKHYNAFNIGTAYQLKTATNKNSNRYDYPDDGYFYTNMIRANNSSDREYKEYLNYFIKDRESELRDAIKSGKSQVSVSGMASTNIPGAKSEISNAKKLKKLLSSDIKPVGYTDSPESLRYPIYKKPVVEPPIATKPIGTNVKYDPTYENLRMRPLWATMAKQDTTSKIGTLKSLDPLYEKGFTYGEAQKFPEEIRKQYKLDYPIYQNGGEITKEDYLKQQHQDYLKSQAEKGRILKQHWLKGYKEVPKKGKGGFIPMAQEGISIRNDDRNWLERFNDKVYSGYQEHKPQLLKDFPLLDLPGMMVEYVTGHSDPEIGGISMLPTPILRGLDKKLVDVTAKGMRNKLSKTEIAKEQLEKLGITSTQREGYLPGVSELLYKRVDPRGYPESNNLSWFLRDLKNKLSGNPVKIKALKEQTEQLVGGYNQGRDDAWRMYLGLPQKYKTFRIAEAEDISTYFPHKKGSETFSLVDFPRSFNPPPVGKYKVNSHGPVMGNYGEYTHPIGIEYYDFWDLEPVLPIKYKGKPVKLPVSKVIGKPFETRGMKYVDEDMRKLFQQLYGTREANKLSYLGGSKGNLQKGGTIPKAQEGVKIQADRRNWLQRTNDKVQTAYNKNKPQLLKDFPLLDLPGMMVEYVTGHSKDPDAGLAMVNPVGKIGKAIKVQQAAGKFKAKEKGINFVKNWIEHPESQKRINEITDLSDAEVMNQALDYAQSTLPTKSPDFIKELVERLAFLSGTNKNFKQSFGILGSELFNTKNLSRGHLVPQSRISKNIGSGNTTSVGLSRHNGSFWIAREAPKKEITTSAVHEATHNITNNKDNIKIKNLTNEAFGGKQGISNLKQLLPEHINTVEYLTDPTEVYARVMELRNQFKLKPGQIVDKKLGEKIFTKGSLGKTPVDVNFFDFMNVTRQGLPKKSGAWFTDLFNKLPAATPIGIVGSSMYMNNQNKSKE